jgi:hypothetical protein
MVTDESRQRSLDALNGWKSEILDIFLSRLSCFAAQAPGGYGEYLNFCVDLAHNAWNPNRLHPTALSLDGGERGLVQ